MRLFLAVESLSSSWLKSGEVAQRLRSMDSSIHVIAAHHKTEYVDVLGQLDSVSNELLALLDVSHSERDCNASVIFFVSETSWGRIRKGAIPMHFLFVTIPDDVVALLWGKPSRRKMSSLIAEVEKYVSLAKKLVQCLAVEFSSQDRKTPFLLPESLSSSDLARAFYGRFDELVEHGHHEIKRARSEFVRDLGVVAASSSSRTLFRSPGGLEARPCERGGARHGVPKLDPTKGHFVNCCLGSVLRFGIPFDFRFHYDVLARGGANVQNQELPDCHGMRCERTGSPHLNIYPNSYIR